MTDELVTRGASGLAVPSPVADFRALDKYAGGMQEERVRQGWLATISAGYKRPKRGDENKPPDQQQMVPQATREEDKHHIHLHDDAPGLDAALQATNYRRLTIAFLHNDPHLFIQPTFRKYAASGLVLFGTHEKLTVWEGDARNRRRRDVFAGEAEYAALLADPEVKVHTDVFFVLARWLDGRNSELYWPDGSGVYRLRMTSRHSLNSLLSTLKNDIAPYTHDHVAGIPLDMFLRFPTVQKPDGVRQKIARWEWRMNPPEPLTTTIWRAAITSGMEQAQAVHVLPPRTVTADDAAAEDFGAFEDDSVIDAPSDERLQRMQQEGPLCDPQQVEAAYFAMVRGTDLDGGPARANLVRSFTNGETGSLAQMLEDCSQERADAFLAMVRDRLPPEGPSSAVDDDYERAVAAKPAEIVPPPDAFRQAQQADEERSAASAETGRQFYGEPEPEAPPEPPADVQDAVIEDAIAAHGAPPVTDTLGSDKLDADAICPPEFDACTQLYEALSKEGVKLSRPFENGKTSYYREWRDGALKKRDEHRIKGVAKQ